MSSSASRDGTSPDAGRRQAFRVAYQEGIIFKPKNRQNLQGVVVNVSEGGLLLVAREPLSRGTELMVYLQLKGDRKQQLCMASGKIVHIQQETGAKARAYGIQFDSNISFTSRQMLHDFVTEKNGGIAPERPHSSKPATSPSKLEEDTSTIEKTPPPREAPAPVKYERTSERAYGKKEKTKKEVKVIHFKGAKKFREPRSNVTVGIVVGFFVGVLIIGKLLFGVVGDAMLEGDLSDIVPMINIEIKNETLHAQAKSAWLAETRPDSRREQVTKLAEKMWSEGIKGGILTSKEGKVVAQILIERESNNSRHHIRVIQ